MEGLSARWVDVMEVSTMARFFVVLLLVAGTIGCDVPIPEYPVEYECVLPNGMMVPSADKEDCYEQHGTPLDVWEVWQDPCHLGGMEDALFEVSASTELCREFGGALAQDGTDKCLVWGKTQTCTWKY